MAKSKEFENSSKNKATAWERELFEQIKRTTQELEAKVSAIKKKLEKNT